VREVSSLLCYITKETASVKPRTTRKYQNLYLWRVNIIVIKLLSINQFIKKHKQYNIKASIEKRYMRTMCSKGQKGRDGTNNCP